MIGMGVGLIIQPESYGVDRVVPFPVWAADNGCYPPDDDPKRKAPWSAARWGRMMGGISALDDEVRARCLFCLVPDWPFSHEKTMERFRKYAPVVRAFGLPLAFAIQDGSTEDNVPWDDFDVSFLAGTTSWKLGRECMDAAYRSRARGKWVHLGRCNSWRRMDWASYVGADSQDGTFMKHGAPTEMTGRLKVFLDNNAPRLTQKAAVAE